MAYQTEVSWWSLHHQYNRCFQYAYWSYGLSSQRLPFIPEALTASWTWMLFVSVCVYQYLKATLIIIFKSVPIWLMIFIGRQKSSALVFFLWVCSHYISKIPKIVLLPVLFMFHKTHCTYACKYCINANNSVLCTDETCKMRYNRSIKFFRGFHSIFSEKGVFVMIDLF